MPFNRPAENSEHDNDTLACRCQHQWNMWFPAQHHETPMLGGLVHPLPFPAVPSPAFRNKLQTSLTTPTGKTRGLCPTHKPCVLSCPWLSYEAHGCSAGTPWTAALTWFGLPSIIPHSSCTWELKGVPVLFSSLFQYIFPPKLSFHKIKSNSYLCSNLHLGI